MDGAHRCRHRGAACDDVADQRAADQQGAQAPIDADLGAVEIAGVAVGDRGGRADRARGHQAADVAANAEVVGQRRISAIGDAADVARGDPADIELVDRGIDIKCAGHRAGDEQLRQRHRRRHRARAHEVAGDNQQAGRLGRRAFVADRHRTGRVVDRDDALVGRVVRDRTDRARNRVGRRREREPGAAGRKLDVDQAVVGQILDDQLPVAEVHRADVQRRVERGIADDADLLHDRARECVDRVENVGVGDDVEQSVAAELRIVERDRANARDHTRAKLRDGGEDGRVGIDRSEDRHRRRSQRRRVVGGEASVGAGDQRIGAGRGVDAVENAVGRGQATVLRADRAALAQRCGVGVGRVDAHQPSAADGQVVKGEERAAAEGHAADLHGLIARDRRHTRTGRHHRDGAQVVDAAVCAVDPRQHVGRRGRGAAQPPGNVGRCVRPVERQPHHVVEQCGAVIAERQRGRGGRGRRGPGAAEGIELRRRHHHLGIGRAVGVDRVEAPGRIAVEPDEVIADRTRRRAGDDRRLGHVRQVDAHQLPVAAGVGRVVDGDKVAARRLGQPHDPRIGGSADPDNPQFVGDATVGIDAQQPVDVLGDVALDRVDPVDLRVEIHRRDAVGVAAGEAVDRHLGHLRRLRVRPVDREQRQTVVREQQLVGVGAGVDAQHAPGRVDRQPEQRAQHAADKHAVRRRRRVGDTGDRLGDLHLAIARRIQPDQPPVGGEIHRHDPRRRCAAGHLDQARGLVRVDTEKLPGHLHLRRRRIVLQIDLHEPVDLGPLHKVEITLHRETEHVVVKRQRREQVEHGLLNGGRGVAQVGHAGRDARGGLDSEDAAVGVADQQDHVAADGVTVDRVEAPRRVGAEAARVIREHRVGRVGDGE